MNDRIKVGAAENILEVPLFAELAGYGPFRGRRNIGVRDPLYCRVMTFNDGTRRNVIVVTDTISSDELHCRVMRMKLATEFAIYPESIMFVATHTHSSTAPGASLGIGYENESYEFNEIWMRTVRQTLIDALANEEEVRAFAGKAKIRKPIGERRTTSEDKHTDPEIRFIKIVRPDGSVKALMHNHAMHGVVFGPQLYVSADWMGDANAKIKARKLAEIPFFLYGTAGDINVIWTHPKPEERHLNLEWVGTSYVDDLEAGLNDCHEISLGPTAAALKTVELPTEKVDAAECRANAEKLLAKLPNKFEKLLVFISDRLREMAVLADRGHDFRILKDLQVLKMGDLAVYALPGEAFLGIGEELMAKSEAAFPIAVSVANGHAGYLPVKEMFDQYPDMFCCDDFGAFGFYEVWFGPGRLLAKFKPNIVDFVVENLLKISKTI